MTESDDRRENKLPVTAEVGSEGGSFADPTTQVATFEDDVARGVGHGGVGSVATQASRMHEVQAAGGGQSRPASDGIVRYPTEPPSSPSASGGRRTSGIDWRTGLAGAAAGAGVILALVANLRRRENART
ncbi:hypothetical protein BH23ACI1_BH23ACI1_08280 [soil metagenome]|nr:hypothetical protein [Acidobacteriota bacterium]